ncbi:MAG: tetratricopeptide repeat protein [Acidobacteria bacterium]|nr:tetratricopeptide repeat protein [Acidobacteriota bacterium]
MSKRQIDCILGIIVIALAATAGISYFRKSETPVIREAGPGENPGGAMPENHPPAEIAARLAALIQMSAENPRNADIRKEIGNAYYDLGEYEKAMESYRESLEIEPGDPGLETDLATCLHYLGRDEEALALLNGVLNSRPDFAPALYNKGVVLIHGMNDPEGGIAAWEELLKQDMDPARRADIERSIREYKASAR